MIYRNYNKIMIHFYHAKFLNAHIATIFLCDNWWQWFNLRWHTRFCLIIENSFSSSYNFIDVQSKMKMKKKSYWHIDHTNINWQFRQQINNWHVSCSIFIIFMKCVMILITQDVYSIFFFTYRIDSNPIKNRSKKKNPNLL